MGAFWVIARQRQAGQAAKPNGRQAGQAMKTAGRASKAAGVRQAGKAAGLAVFQHGQGRQAIEGRR